jgi:NAD(P)-dependent dehydrogenase (short-subunit alcohol dehydrogenase family)
MSQRVLVTAGAAGIGREIACAFAATGATVFVCDIDADGLGRLAQEIPGVLTATCDVANREEVAGMVAAAAAALGGLDVLVNNAGIAGPTAPVEEVRPDDWDTVVQVNLTGTFDVTRLAIPHLKRSASGVIVIISSALAGSATRTAAPTRRQSGD